MANLTKEPLDPTDGDGDEPCGVERATEDQEDKERRREEAEEWEEEELDLIERVHKLQRRTERIANEVDAVAYDIEKLRLDLAALCAKRRSEPRMGRTHKRSRPRRHPLQSDESRTLVEQAERGATSVEIRRRALGSADVRIDGGRWFRLSALLAEMLSLIADPTRGTPGEIVPWKPHERLCRLLSKYTGQPVSRRYLSQIAEKLRRAFRKAHQNYFLIQSDRHLGIRFNLRVSHPSAARTEVTGGDQW